MDTGVRTIDVDRDADGQPTRLGVVFGPHYFFEVHSVDEGPVTVILGATHHGFRADASDVGGELEVLINEIRDMHPATTVD